MRANPYTEGGVRLQKVLAQAGVASRRASEQMIADGRVSVDGTVVRSQGVRVDPATQVIHVDGERLILDETKHIVLADWDRLYDERPGGTPLDCRSDR